MSSATNFVQDILWIFMSGDNTKNNHVNRERKTNYIFNMIWNKTDINHDTCCSNNLFHICWHNIKQDYYHAWYVLLEQYCSRRLVHHPWTVLFEQTWTTLLTTMSTGCSTTLFTPGDNLQQVVRFHACNTNNLWVCMYMQF